MANIEAKLEKRSNKLFYGNYRDTPQQDCPDVQKNQLAGSPVKGKKIFLKNFPTKIRVFWLIRRHEQID